MPGRAQDRLLPLTSATAARPPANYVADKRCCFSIGALQQMVLMNAAARFGGYREALDVARQNEDQRTGWSGEFVPRRRVQTAALFVIERKIDVI